MLLRYFDETKFGVKGVWASEVQMIREIQDFDIVYNILWRLVKKMFVELLR